MRKFAVWAPEAGGVDLVLEGCRVPMVRGAGGWWAVSAAAGQGSLYAFDPGGGQPLPDPRSRYQPSGVNGPSCVVDLESFPWTDDNWQARPLPSAVIYEMHIGTFTAEGTFDAATSRLDYLRELGVTHVELMPVNQFSGAWGWGYDGVGLFAPHNTYGSPEALMRFVDTAHAKGLAVLLDVVYNHLGPSGNYLSRFGPYFTRRHNTPWGEAVNLDGPDCGEVRRFICDNALMWLRDYHFDGLRIDAVHALLDTGTTHLLEQLATEVEHLSVVLGRHLVLIAESDLNDPRVVHARTAGGHGIHAQWSDDFHHALHSVLTGETTGYYSDFGRIEHLAKALKQVFVYDGAYSAFRRRRHGKPPLGLPGHAFLGYAQNHDQVGNRAAGERLAHLAGLRRSRIAAGLVLTSPFVPMLFQGEEWAASTPFQYFTHHEDPELGRAVSAGRRSEFVDLGWIPDNVPDPQDQATFERSKLRWEEQTSAPHARMLDWYCRLIRFRRSAPELAGGNLERVQVTFDEEAGWLSMRRGGLYIVCNFSGESHCLPAPGARAVAIASEDTAAICEGGVRLGPETFAVLALSEIA